MHRFLAALLVLLASLLSPQAAMADPADVQAAARGVVRVVIIGRDGEEIFPISHGSGFSVGGGRIVTNAHVIAEAQEDDRLSIGIVPAEGSEAVYARVVAVSERNDLALLRLTQNIPLPPLTIAGNPAQTGSVTAIGFPMNVDRAQGLATADIFRAQPPVTATGFLSGRRPSRDFDTLLHTASIARGNSGGPLVDDCGRVIGVNSFGTESTGSDAEFFFAISTRELLPFLRANGVTPQLNALPCRALADIEAEEAARNEAQAERAEMQARQEASALAAETAELQRTETFKVIEARSNGMALSLLALIAGLAAAAAAAWFHVAGRLRERAIAGVAAIAFLLAAAFAWTTRPAFAEIDDRVADALRERQADGETGGTIAAQAAVGSASFQCVLDPDRSRVTGAPATDIPIDWQADGCTNERTQYGLAGGGWTRVFVPSSEAAVSVNRFDPAAGELVMERYLLDMEAMRAARAARGGYNAPSCGDGDDAATRLGRDQSAILADLPPRPNERLVYGCTASAGQPR